MDVVGGFRGHHLPQRRDLPRDEHGGLKPGGQVRVPGSLDAVVRALTLPTDARTPPATIRASSPERRSTPYLPLLVDRLGRLPRDVDVDVDGRGVTIIVDRRDPAIPGAADLAKADGEIR